MKNQTLLILLLLLTAACTKSAEEQCEKDIIGTWQLSANPEEIIVFDNDSMYDSTGSHYYEIRGECEHLYFLEPDGFLELETAEFLYDIIYLDGENMQINALGILFSYQKI